MLDEKLILLSKPEIASSLDVEHRWNTYSTYTVSDGLLSAVDDSGTLADSDMIQPTAANMPQFGYDQVAKFYADTLTLTRDVNEKVSVWNNSASVTTRSISNLTQSTLADQPVYNPVDGTVDFTDAQCMNASLIAKVLNQCTLYSYFYLSSSVFVDGGLVTQYHLIKLNNIRLSITLNPLTSLYYLEVYITTTAGQNISSVISYSTLNDFKTNLCDRYLFLLFRFNTVNRTLFLNNVSINEFANSLASITIPQMTNQATVEGAAGRGVFFKIKSFGFYDTYLSNVEANLLYVNRDDNSYILPRSGIMATGNSFLKSLFIQNTVVTNFTFRAWVYLQSILPYNASYVDQFIANSDTFVGGATKGFHFKIQKSSGGNAYFRVLLGNGTTSVALNTTSISLASFRSLYTNKYSSVGFTLKNQGATDLLSVFINGNNVAQSSIAAGSFITSTDGYINLLQSSSGTTGLIAGNKILDSFISFNRAYSATEMRRKYSADIVEHPEFAN